MIHGPPPAPDHPRGTAGACPPLRHVEPKVQASHRVERPIAGWFPASRWRKPRISISIHGSISK